MVSYPILSSHVFRGGSTKHSPKIEAKDIASGIPMPPTVASYGHGQWSYAEKNGDAVTITSSGNQYKTSLNSLMYHGPITQIDDRGMNRWIANGTINPPARNKYIDVMPNTTYTRGVSELGMWLPHPHDTKVNLKTTPRLVEAIGMNDVGKFVSRDANNYDRFRRLLWDRTNRPSEVAGEYIKFLSKKGFSVGNNLGISELGVEKADFTAAYYPGLGRLVTEVDFRDKARVNAARYGLTDSESIDAMEQMILLHEFAHVTGVRSERLQGLLQAEFYSMMASRHKGSKKGRIYQALAREGSDYARRYSAFEPALPKRYQSDGRFETLVKKFKDEAEALGIEDAGEISRYVNNRVMNVMSGGAITDPKEKSSEGLERIVETHDSKVIPITSARSLKYKGKAKYEKPGKTYERPSAKAETDTEPKDSDAKEADSKEGPKGSTSEPEAQAKAA